MKTESAMINFRSGIIVLLAACPSIFGVLITPAFPQLKFTFSLDEERTSLLMMSYLFGYALGQLPYGFISNYFGRKKALWIGCGIATSSSLTCAIAPTFPILLIGRFFMAIGAAAGLQGAFTIIGDLYDKLRMQKMLSLIILSSAIIPGIASLVGGFITTYFNWECCFLCLALFGILTCFLIALLPETSMEKKKMSIQIVINGYKKTLKNRTLIFCSLSTGCGAGIIYIFASLAPFITKNNFNLSAHAYGLWNMLPSLGLLLGSIFAQKLTRISSKQQIYYGLLILFLASFLILNLYFFHPDSPFVLFFSMMLLEFGLALLFINTAAIALKEAKDKAYGSSLFNFINLLFCSLLFILTTNLPFSVEFIFYFIFLGITFLLSFLLRFLVYDYAESEK